MRSALFVLLLLTGCRDAEAERAPEPAQASGPCNQRLFEGVRFTVCADRSAWIELRSGKRGFAELGLPEHQIAFAMNAGMFGEDGGAIGLLIENGQQGHAINRRRGGGNFHLLPNGVFLVRKDGRAEVVTSERFKPSPNIAFATQSGPMLVIDGQLHPKFEADGVSRNIRNGVGIAPNGTAVFVISEDFVSFGKFARFFRDALKANNALYFDGSVSSLWDPANHRMDSHAELGPVVVALKPVASAPGRAGRARS